jgi:predicted MFS family arabinose efflux permease
VSLFSALYFVQGIAEPTEGLIAQPVRSLLKSWNQDDAQISTFMVLMALPWGFKLVYGLLTDFVPLFGQHRRSYLLLSTAVTASGLCYLGLTSLPEGQTGLLLTLLVLPTLGVAFSDVVIDALMVDKGQPLGLTGVLQSAQWTAMYAGTIIAGTLGGMLSEGSQHQSALLICGLLTFATLVLIYFGVPEQRAPRAQSELSAALSGLAAALRSPAVLTSALFVTLWNFNPFNTTVLYLYATKEIGLSETYYGTTVSLVSVGAMIGALIYGTYCRRVSFKVLIHVSIVTGILATLAYWGLEGERSAAVISVIVGFTYMTGNLVQFDMVARACPPQAAGTTFATLMGLTNFSALGSAALGGWFYASWSSHWGPTVSFQLLVLVGALSTAACWLLFPWLKNRF